jgi:hypothetical protein
MSPKGRKPQLAVGGGCRWGRHGLFGVGRNVRQVPEFAGHPSWSKDGRQDSPAAVARYASQIDTPRLDLPLKVSGRSAASAVGRHRSQESGSVARNSHVAKWPTGARTTVLRRTAGVRLWQRDPRRRTLPKTHQSGRTPTFTSSVPLQQSRWNMSWRPDAPETSYRLAKSRLVKKHRINLLHSVHIGTPHLPEYVESWRRGRRP